MNGWGIFGIAFLSFILGTLWQWWSMSKKYEALGFIVPKKSLAQAIEEHKKK